MTKTTVTMTDTTVIGRFLEQVKKIKKIKKIKYH